MVSQYTGLNILQVEELDFLDFLLYKRDAVIYQMSQTKEGEEYLNNAWRLEQTSPDRKQLREKFGERR